MQKADETKNGIREIWTPANTDFDKTKVKDWDQGISDGGGTINVSLCESAYEKKPWLFIEVQGEYTDWSHDTLLTEAEQILLKV